MEDPVLEAVELLRRRHATLLEEASRVAAAIGALGYAVDSPSSSAVSRRRAAQASQRVQAAKESARIDAARRHLERARERAANQSIKRMVLETLESGPGPWKARDVEAALEGKVESPDLNSAIRTAFVQLMEEDLVARVAYGAYAAKKNAEQHFLVNPALLDPNADKKSS